MVVKTEEVELLWERFQQLGPDKSGHVDRTVFSNNELYSNIFCKQVNNITMEYTVPT